MNHDLIHYYRQRASEYEQIYLKPERQHDLAQLTAWLKEALANRSLVEIACGTGYWTQRISETARSILATDINTEVLTIAQAKSYPHANVRFMQADMDDLTALPETVDALFGGFIWSHIPLQTLDTFLDRLHQRLVHGGKVIFVDNLYVEGSSLPITHHDDHGNTYQQRALQDGTHHVVLKNFPNYEFLCATLADKSRHVQWIPLTYYWMLVYEVGEPI